MVTGDRDESGNSSLPGSLLFTIAVTIIYSTCPGNFFLILAVKLF